MTPDQLCKCGHKRETHKQNTCLACGYENKRIIVCACKSFEPKSSQSNTEQLKEEVHNALRNLTIDNTSSPVDEVLKDMKACAIGDCDTMDLIKSFAKGIAKVRENELEFLLSLKIMDLYEQATKERSHFYVASKAKAIIERISFIEAELKKLKESGLL